MHDDTYTSFRLTQRHLDQLEDIKLSWQLNSHSDALDRSVVLCANIQNILEMGQRVVLRNDSEGLQFGLAFPNEFVPADNVELTVPTELRVSDRTADRMGALREFLGAHGDATVARFVIEIAALVSTAQESGFALCRQQGLSWAPIFSDPAEDPTNPLPELVTFSNEEREDIQSEMNRWSSENSKHLALAASPEESSASTEGNLVPDEIRHSIRVFGDQLLRLKLQALTPDMTLLEVWSDTGDFDRAKIWYRFCGISRRYATGIIELTPRCGSVKIDASFAQLSRVLCQIDVRRFP